MVRTVIVGTVLIAGGLVSPDVTAGQSGGAPQATTQVSPADASAFIGDWTLNLQGPNGPGTFDLAVKVEKEKVVGEISVETMPTQPIVDITKADKSLFLRYAFDYEGNPVSAVVSLTPTDEGKVSAQIDFAGGAYIMTGAATKKDKEKEKDKAK